MTNSNELRRVIQESGLKLQFLAKELGLSRYGFQKKLDGKSEFKASEIERLCQLLRLEDLQIRQNIFFAKKVD